jgi:hypothetical protein
VTKHLTPHQETQSQDNESQKTDAKKEETKDGSEERAQSAGKVLSKQKVVLSKDTGIKRKTRISVIQNSGSQQSSGHDLGEQSDYVSK